MAIARDTTSKYSAAATTVSGSHTCTGSNLIVFSCVWVADPANDPVTGVTYNGVAMTQLSKVLSTSVGPIYLYYMINPPTGAQTVTMSKTGTDTAYLINASYTGVKQTGFPDAQGTSGYTFVSTMSTTLTTVAANCWAFMFSKVSATGNTGADSAVLWINGVGNDATQLYDSNGAIASGGTAEKFTVNATGNNFMGQIMVTFAPVAAAANGNFLAFM